MSGGGGGRGGRGGGDGGGGGEGGGGGGGEGATQSERTVLHHDGLCESGVCCVPVPPEAHVYFARNAIAPWKICM